MIDTDTTTTSLAPAVGWFAAYRKDNQRGTVACWALQADGSVVGLVAGKRGLIPATSYDDFTGYMYLGADGYGDF
jgi:hypothetical protein